MLAPGVAARVICLYGEAEIQINRMIPYRDHRAVARHTIECHGDRCAADDCLTARGWLRNARAVRLVAAEPA